MTNREMIINALRGTDDAGGGGETDQNIVVVHINCPYYDGDERAKCHGEEGLIDEWSTCLDCKYEWLFSEVDE